MKQTVFVTRMAGWPESVSRLLDTADLGQRLQGYSRIIIKPNLVEALAPPITTPVALVDALIGYLQQKFPKCEIIVGEGTGSIEYDTFHCFEKLGYQKMAAQRGIKLLDLNTAPLIKKKNPECTRLPELYLPEIVEDAFLLSVPVLKAHSLAGVTLTMKNMMGCVPPSHYREGNSWGKSSFHREIQTAIFDLNRHRCADFTLLDATVGMAEHHLGGRHCRPPVGQLVASWNPVAIDSYGASLLGVKWNDISHLRLAHQVLGNAEPLEIVEVAF